MWKTAWRCLLVLLLLRGVELWRSWAHCCTGEGKQSRDDGRGKTGVDGGSVWLQGREVGSRVRAKMI